MRVELNPCYLLHRRPYLEGSWLLEAFSRRHGRVGLVARGARRGGGKRRRPPLGIFQRFLFTWGGRGELGTLYHWETVEPSFALSGKASLAALYQNELLLRLLHRYEPHTDLFDAYDHSLAALAAVGGGRHDEVLRRFEVSLLRILGYGPDWDREARTGEEVQPDAWYHYETDSGFCRRPEGDSDRLIPGRALLWLAGKTERYDAQSAGRVKALMRRLIDDRLAGRVLASRELYGDFLRLERGMDKVSKVSPD